MGLKPRTRMTDIKLDKIFIGSCTNSRIEDLRAAAAVVKGRRVASNIRLAMVVPGSGLVKAQAEKEGLDRVFRDAGFDWREPGCSMCLGMNPDQLGRRRALRLDLEPQLRGPPGRRRPHPSGESRDGGRGGDRRPLRRHEDMALMDRFTVLNRSSRRSIAPTSTPTRSSRRNTCSRSSAPASATPVRAPGARIRSSCSTSRATRARRSCSRADNFGCGSSREHAPWALLRLRLSRRDRTLVRGHLLQQLASRTASCRSRLTEAEVDQLFYEARFVPGLPPACRPGGQTVATPDGSQSYPLRHRPVPQVLPAERPRRDRPDPAPRRRDPRLRRAAQAAAPLVFLRGMNVAVLPGDGIGPEIIAQARSVLEQAES